MCFDGGLGWDCFAPATGKGIVPSFCRWPCDGSNACGSESLSCDVHGLCYETQPKAAPKRSVKEQAIFLLNDKEDDYWDAAAEAFRKVLKADPSDAEAECYLDLATRHRRSMVDGGAICKQAQDAVPK